MGKANRISSDAADFPAVWVIATLGDVTFPRGVKVKPSEMGNAPFIGLKSIEAHSMKLLDVGRTRDVKSAGSYFGRGDVLYGRLRPYLNKVYQPDFSGLASGEFIVFPSQSHLVNAYLKYFLNQLEFASFATRLNTGDRPRVDFDQLQDYPFPLPPLPEQRRIVAEIEKQFTRLDASEAALKRAQANLKRCRASVLKAACLGKLVPTEAELAQAEGRDYEPADQLLKRILTERRARWEAQTKRRGKYKEPVAVDKKAMPKIPQGWEWCSLDQLANIGTGSTPLTSNSQFYQEGSVPWVRSSALNNPMVSSPSKFVTEQAVRECRLVLYPPNTLLIAMYGEGKTRGKCSELLIQSTINQAIAAVTLPESAIDCRSFIRLFLTNNYEETRRLSSGGVQPNLNLGIVRQIAVPLPPLAEQKRIVPELESHLSIIQQAEATVDAGLKRTERLRQSILKQAFCGQLVPQDPDDEPATLLLKRIRAERAAAKAASSSKRQTRRRRSRAASNKQLLLFEDEP